MANRRCKDVKRPAIFGLHLNFNQTIADGLQIHPSAITPATVDTYDDHRIAMSLALIGLKVPGIVVRDPGCVAKTFPDFFARLEELRR